MKILVMGDIHGRTWWKDIIELEKPDKVIFLGDYVSTHDEITGEEQFSNLVDIMDYKASNPDTTIMLRGNHDIQHLGYSWAECSGFDDYVYTYMSSYEFKNDFLNKTTWIHEEDIDGEKYIFSHAGVSKTWLDYSNIKELNKINNFEPCERFGFSPSVYSDYYGTSPTQPCTWIRPQTLIEYAIEGYNQVVGHTPVKYIFKAKMLDGKDLWLCDNMKDKEYLIIENNKFITKKL